jgi:hypothetical protein
MTYHNNYTSKIPKPAFVFFLLLIVICYSLMTYVSIKNRELYILLLQEDGPLENIATVSVLLAALFFFAAYLRHRGTRVNRFYLLFSIALLFLFLEEISWGQRIFGIETPALFEDLNAQKEINLHNYSPIYKHINKIAYAGLQFYLVGIVLLTLIFKKLYSTFLKFQIPIPSPATALLMCANYFLYYDLFLSLASRFGYHGKVTVNYVELYEAGIELSLLFFSIECFYRGITWINGGEEYS